jgi:hypothetical protein
VRYRLLTGALLAPVLFGLSAPVAIAAEEPASEDRCDVSSWELTWGVKESFRAYLSGSIANGEWSTSGNVTYHTPDFTIAGSEGWISPDGANGSLQANGGIRFIGHGGILDQTLSAPSVWIAGETLTLVFDIAGDTQEGVSIQQEQVRFVSGQVQPQIDPETGVWSITDEGMVLTSEGAYAFGTYPAGEPFDPVTLEVNVEPGCLEEKLSLSGAIGWVAGISVAVSALALVITGLVRRSRGRERPAPPAS